MSLLLLLRPRTTTGVVYIVTGRFDRPRPGGPDAGSPAAARYDQPSPGGPDPGSPGGAFFDPGTPGKGA